MLWWILILFLSILFVWQGMRIKMDSGLPLGRVVYSDSGSLGRIEHAFFSRKHQVIGKPDYLVRSCGTSIPVEVKFTRSPPGGPYLSHVMQVAAYCLLVEDQFGVRPTHGLIKYNDGVFEIEYTPDLERELLQLLASMRHDKLSPVVNRSHKVAMRCRGCGVQASCEQALA